MIILQENCYICGNHSNFSIPEGATLLREATCSKCGASIRNSDTAKIIVNKITGKSCSLSESLGTLNSVNILEAQSLGPINRVLCELPGYSCFEYIDSVAPGYSNEYGVMSNDLENLTYKSNSFDLVISQDVLEHVNNPTKAFSEINRVLMMGGYHIFTVPIHEQKPTISRSNLPKVFHGDPLRQDGALVCTDWGNDICKFIDQYGMETEKFMVHNFYSPSEITNVDESYEEYLKTEAIYYYRYNSIVFASKKVRSL